MCSQLWQRQFFSLIKWLEKFHDFIFRALVTSILPLATQSLPPSRNSFKNYWLLHQFEIYKLTVTTTNWNFLVFFNGILLGNPTYLLTPLSKSHYISVCCYCIRFSCTEITASAWPRVEETSLYNSFCSGQRRPSPLPFPCTAATFRVRCRKQALLTVAVFVR